MENSKKPQPKVWVKIPENLASMSDEEMRIFAESLWLVMTTKIGSDYEER